MANDLMTAELEAKKTTELKVVSDNTALAPAKHSDPLAAYADAVAPQYIVGEMLRFSKGDWIAGKDDILAIGTMFTVAPDELLAGWIKWFDSKPVEHEMVRVNDGSIPKQRTELGDTDPAQWAKDKEGKPKALPEVYVVQSFSRRPLFCRRQRRYHLVRADYLAGLTDEVSREECNVAGATANIEYAHAGADPRLLKELTRDWLDVAALYYQTLKLLIGVTERVDRVIHSCPPCAGSDDASIAPPPPLRATGMILGFSQRVKADRCLLLAQSGHPSHAQQCPLLGVKRTSCRGAPMSAYDPKLTSGQSFFVIRSHQFRSHRPRR
jgi:hypothetical protein